MSISNTCRTESSRNLFHRRLCAAGLKRLTLHVIDIPETDVEQLRGDLRGVEVKWDKPDAEGMKQIPRFFDSKQP